MNFPADGEAVKILSVDLAALHQKEPAVKVRYRDQTHTGIEAHVLGPSHMTQKGGIVRLYTYGGVTLTEE